MNSNLTYFSLIQKVGDQGCYQFLVYGLVAMIWFLFGISSISIVFMFLNPGFDCTSLGVSKLECENYVCSHFQGAQRSQYLAEKEMESLVTEFGPFHCENNYLINFFKALLFLGMLLGNLATNCLVGRISLKKIIVASLGISVAGSLIMCLSVSMAMANIGWFLIGFGMNGQIYYVVSIISEIVSPELESKLTGSLIFCGIVGNLIASGGFSLLKHWRKVSIYFILIPFIL